MHLSPQDVAAAEACGITFLPATPEQVQRLVMQRKIFHLGGRPALATRGGGFYETAGTLQRLIEQGLQQQRDLAATRPEPPPSPSPAPTIPAPASSALASPAEVETLPVQPPPRRARQRRAPAAPPEPSLEPPRQMEAGEAAGRATRPRSAGPRWLVAGAERRGRAAKHWSTRQR